MMMMMIIRDDDDDDDDDNDMMSKRKIMAKPTKSFFDVFQYSEFFVRLTVHI